MSNIYLVGFMGVGKTATGRIVADRLGRSFVDLDDVIEKQMGMSIREIFTKQGEDFFRQAETAELERTTSYTDLVVATGGGAFASSNNRRLIRDSGGIAVFLDPPWNVILRRLQGDDTARPKWRDADQAHTLFGHRRPDYLDADVHLELRGDESPALVTEMVCGALTETTCAS